MNTGGSRHTGRGLCCSAFWNILNGTLGRGGLTETDFHTLVHEGTIGGGMIPKLENAFAALSAGVRSVRITDVAHLQGGTLIY